MRLHTGRLRRGIVAVALVVVAAGCGAGGPTPPPESNPRYGQIPEDLCSRLQFEAVFGRFALDLARSHEDGSDYRTERTYWRERCDFGAIAPDEHFATALGEFQPSGAIQVRVYHGVAGAVQAYDQEVANYIDLPEETGPDPATADLTGWWGDSGKSLQTALVLDPDDFTLGDFAASQLDVTHLIRHENLVLVVYAGAVAPTGETAEAVTLLHDLADALIDETASHLDR
ncbi:hypothetical protein O7543_03985 [Solwaraspora sp. WMMA2080]|uniref:hypothetical protein n=1 Tax=unclassified Solwaraspora TaxID=2627926 RepID=UPI00248C8595|nr:MULTISPECIES: hypothetical protein [unclassified Solwaraspora]WBB99801.1 hypothetical protein O7553_13385 [Solwaraspora sp. WMMA2059]WBC21651.1 hypothetical protein O7543_03985 [Solwaraspora sp. WMMA2080]